MNNTTEITLTVDDVQKIVIEHINKRYGFKLSKEEVKFWTARYEDLIGSILFTIKVDNVLGNNNE